MYIFRHSRDAANSCARALLLFVLARSGSGAGGMSEATQAGSKPAKRGSVALSAELTSCGCCTAGGVAVSCRVPCLRSPMNDSDRHQPPRAKVLPPARMGDPAANVATCGCMWECCWACQGAERAWAALHAQSAKQTGSHAWQSEPSALRERTCQARCALSAELTGSRRAGPLVAVVLLRLASASAIREVPGSSRNGGSQSVTSARKRKFQAARKFWHLVSQGRSRLSGCVVMRRPFAPISDHRERQQLE